MSLRPLHVTGLVLAVAVVALLAVMFLQSRPAYAEIDLTGTWKFSFVQPEVGFECPDAQVVQSGSDVDLNCGFPWAVTFDKTTGRLSGGYCPDLLVGCVGFRGTVSPDGNSVSGVWFFSSVPSEFPFSGARKALVTPTPTPTDTPPPPVGGIALDPDLGALALETAGSSGGTSGLLAGIAAAVATGVVALGGAARCRSRGTLQKLASAGTRRGT